MVPVSVGKLRFGAFFFLAFVTACTTTNDFEGASVTYERSRAALEMPMRSIYSGYSDVGEYACNYAGTRIHYNGNTTLQLVNCLMEAPSGSRTLSITSSGGNVDFGIFAAQVVSAMALDVEVVGWCASSCANYILPAAKRVYVDQHSVVFVHGAPQPPDRGRLVEAISKSGLTKDSPGFDAVVDDNMERSELTYRLHNNFKAQFQVGDYYYNLADISSAPEPAAKAGTSKLVYVDPGWLRACMPDVEVVAEAPNARGLQELFPKYSLFSFSQVRGRENKCFV